MSSSERARQFDVKASVDGDVTTVRVSGELDIATAEMLTETLEAIHVSTGRSLVIDLSAVSFMDSTGLRILIGANRRAGEDGYRLSIVTGDSPAGRVLELSRMDEHMHVIGSLD
ncbi:MAG: STAS domain-containing protein [Solirubrobacterales bacterium]